VQNIVVLKFGSSVLRTADDLPGVVEEILRHREGSNRVIAVVSAIGKTTEVLLKQARELCADPEPWATAELLATGERISAALLGIALDRGGARTRVVNPREIGLEVKGEPLDGEPIAVNLNHVEELFREYPILVVPGFFGTDKTGRTQLLGRGGSDLTAAFLAVALGARCRLIKDVDGVYESDPADKASHPRRFADLNYADALHVAGKLIQSKAVEYIRTHRAICEVASLASPFCTRVYEGATRIHSDSKTD
jgi:homoserine dehydrogenase